MLVQEPGKRTEDVYKTEYLTPDASKEHGAHVVDSVYLGMLVLEDANHVTSPCCNNCSRAQENGTGDDAEGVEGRRNGQNAQTDLRLHHEDGGDNPSNLGTC